MCGRFALTLPHDAMAQLFEAAPANDLPQTPNYNTCPATRVHGVVSEGGTRRLMALRWGFLPHWYKTLTGGPLLINARAETIAEKPAFYAACRERRCLIPASGFYEWIRKEDGTRLPWYVDATDGQPLAFASIWQDWTPADGTGETVRSCAIVTTAANAQMSEIHHRMPVILAPADWPLWLGEAGHGAASLMRAAPEGALGVRRVGVAVNSNRAAGAELIAPLAS